MIVAAGITSEAFFKSPEMIKMEPRQTCDDLMAREDKSGYSHTNANAIQIYSRSISVDQRYNLNGALPIGSGDERLWPISLAQRLEVTTFSYS